MGLDFKTRSSFTRCIDWIDSPKFMRRLHRGSGKSAPVLVKKPGQTTHFAPVLYGTCCRIDTIVLLHFRDFLHLTCLQNIVTRCVFFPDPYYSPNPQAAGAPPWAPLEELTTLPDLLVRWVGAPSPLPLSARLLRCLHSVFGASAPHLLPRIAPVLEMETRRPCKIYE